VSFEHVKITTDGRVVWVNTEKGCIARFCPVSGEVFSHAFVADNEEFYYTTPGSDKNGWADFVDKVKSVYEIDVPEKFRPNCDRLVPGEQVKLSSSFREICRQTRNRDAGIHDPPQAFIADARDNNPERRNLRLEAEQFLEAHPRVYELFVKFAMEKKNLGQTFGAKHLAERVRWECGLIRDPEDGDYLLNNNHTAYIARKLVTDYPELVYFIKFRKTRY
jgi:hypothetical protein